MTKPTAPKTDAQAPAQAPETPATTEESTESASAAPTGTPDALDEALADALSDEKDAVAVTLPALTARESIAIEVIAEQERQDTLWGEQNHPDGTGGELAEEVARLSRAATEQAGQTGTLTWRHIVREEIDEAFAETDSDKLRVELVQAAAAIQQWIAAIDRRDG